MTNRTETLDIETMQLRLKRNNRIIAWTIIAFLVFGYTFREWEQGRIFQVEFVRIENARTLTPTELCHGDKFTFEYDLLVSGDGILVRDLTVWRIDPPKTVIYSEFRRSILDEEIEQHHTESYKIPYFYINHETAEMELLPPGRYERRMAISSPSNLEAFTKVSLPFSIKEGCKL